MSVAGKWVTTGRAYLSHHDTGGGWQDGPLPALYGLLCVWMKSQSFVIDIKKVNMSAKICPMTHASIICYIFYCHSNVVVVSEVNEANEVKHTLLNMMMMIHIWDTHEIHICEPRWQRNHTILIDFVVEHVNVWCIYRAHWCDKELGGSGWSDACVCVHMWLQSSYSWQDIPTLAQCVLCGVCWSSLNQILLWFWQMHTVE